MADKIYDALQGHFEKIFKDQIEKLQAEVKRLKHDVAGLEDELEAMRSSRAIVAAILGTIILGLAITVYVMHKRYVG